MHSKTQTLLSIGATLKIGTVTDLQSQNLKGSNISKYCGERTLNLKIIFSVLHLNHYHG